MLLKLMCLPCYFVLMASLPLLDTLQVSPPFNHGLSNDKGNKSKDAQVLDDEELASEFEFSLAIPGTESIQDSYMLPADQLFFKGQLRPLYLPHTCDNVAAPCLPETMSQDISPSSCYSASAMEAFPLSPKAPTCASSLKELLGLKKPQIHGTKDALRYEKLNNKHKASKAPMPLRMLLKSCDVPATDASDLFLSYSGKEAETGSSSNSSDSSPHNESLDHHKSILSRSEAPRTDHFLAKCVSLNFKFLEQKLSSPRNSISRDGTEESISLKVRKGVSSPRTSVSRNDVKKDEKNCSPRNSISLDEAAKDDLTRRKSSADSSQVKENSHRSSVNLDEGSKGNTTRVKISGDSLQAMNSGSNSGEQSPRRKSGGFSRGSLQAMNSGSNSREQSPRRISGGFSPGRLSVGDRSKTGKVSLLSGMERCSSSPQSFRKKYEQMRNARQRDGRRGLERSTSYSSSVRITPVLNVPPIYISPAMRCGKGSKTDPIFGFSKLFTSRKHATTRQTLKFRQQTND